MEEIDYKDIVFQNVARGTDDDIMVVRAYLTDNMEQSGGVLAEKAVWSYIKKVIHSDVEYMARIEGMPKHFAGVVFDELDRDIQATGLSAFPLVMVTPEFDMGLNAMLQAYGIGPLRANTILLNWINPDLPFAFRFKQIDYCFILKNPFYFLLCFVVFFLRY